MGLLSWPFGNSGNSGDDDDVWETYQTGLASNYTEEKINSLRCSDEMKNYIRRDISENRAGGLYSTPGGINTNTNDWWD